MQVIRRQRNDRSDAADNYIRISCYGDGRTRLILCYGSEVGTKSARDENYGRGVLMDWNCSGGRITPLAGHAEETAAFGPFNGHRASWCGVDAPVVPGFQSKPALPARTTPPVRPDSRFIPDPEIGWRLRPTRDPARTVALDANGLSEPARLRSSGASDRRGRDLVTGFVQAQGVGDRENYPAILEAHLGESTVANLAIPGLASIRFGLRSGTRRFRCVRA